MAITITPNSNFEKFVGKQLFTYGQDSSKLKEAVVCVTIGCCCAYPMCAAGYTVDLSLCGALDKVLFAEVDNVRVGACCCTLLVAQYVRAACCAAGTGTLHLYEATANACNVPLAELPDCATDAQCKSFRVHVVGF